MLIQWTPFTSFNYKNNFMSFSEINTLQTMASLKPYINVTTKITQQNTLVTKQLSYMLRISYVVILYVIK